MQEQLDLPLEAASGAWVAEVAVDAPGKDCYSYRVPAELDAVLAVGDGVEVPYGGRSLRGFVLRRHDNPPPGVRLRSISGHRPDCRLPPTLLRLVRWASSYYRCHLGEFLAAAVPAPVRDGVRLRPTRYITALVGDDGGPGVPLTKRQREVWDLLPRQALEYAAACRLAECSSALIDRLVSAGACALSESRAISAGAFAGVDLKDERFALSDEQAVAVAAVAAALEAAAATTFLLYGVTGSGKTLVYMDLAQRVISAGGQVLVLLPEIALTPQLAARFGQRFSRLAVWHSGFSAGERAEQWQRVMAGEVDLVIGTRSALFAPLSGLGLIIVDEEHDSSYKQESDPRYHGRDLAVVYGQQLGIPVLLGSATPSLESYYNALQGKYTPLTLRQRPGGGALPTALLINMREECRAQGRFALLSQDLLDRLRSGKERGEQSIVLLNRRGWSPIVECSSCGHVLMCPHCDIGMTYHRGDAQLRCHYCGHERPHPSHCPACGKATLSSKGLGTEQLESVLAAAIPGLRTLRIDADTVARKHGHAQLLARFAKGEADCLVGTQMVAKGLDFPRVTTVGVVQADRGLGMPDFRAAERTFQLIAQVAGRAGRGVQPGSVVVQAYDTDAPALRCALSLQIKRFYSEELQHRDDHGYPPHGALVRFLWTGPADQEAQVQACAERFVTTALPLMGDCVLLGPNPSSLARINDQVRWHALIKAPTRARVQQVLNQVLPQTHPLASGPVRCIIDVDPLSIS